jgi:hypothetical protein
MPQLRGNEPILGLNIFTSTCKPDENRIFREARRNPN